MLTEPQRARARYLSTRPQSEWTPAERMGLLEGDWGIIRINDFLQAKGYLSNNLSSEKPIWSITENSNGYIFWNPIPIGESIYHINPCQPPWWERLAHYEASQPVEQKQESEEGGPSL